MKRKLVFIPINLAPHYIAEVKRHWWSKWEIVMDGNIPKIWFPHEINKNNTIPIEDMKQQSGTDNY